jgi:hypothetical protein
MTDILTPRTDAAQEFVQENRPEETALRRPVVEARFARQLERENAVAMAALREMQLDDDAAGAALYQLAEMRRAYEEGK